MAEILIEVEAVLGIADRILTLYYRERRKIVHPSVTFFSLPPRLSADNVGHFRGVATEKTFVQDKLRHLRCFSTASHATDDQHLKD